MPGVLVFDIETVPDPDLLANETAMRPEREGIPKIPFNQVILAGAATLAELPDDSYRFERLEILGGTEADILARFWKLAEDKKLVSFNGRSFDLPVLEARSLRHGLALPWYFATDSVREDKTRHLDLLDFLSNGEPRNRARLDEYCKLVGLPGKMGIDGGQVASLFAQARYEELSAYCAMDVLQTLGLFLRVQRLRGAVEPTAFAETLRGVRAAIEQRAADGAGLERERLQAFLRQSEPFWAAG
ncbi:MAG TPA: 3'-5' exonuclease [Myxococcales bacterium]|nr:3'-5' exonuclease [Myxococcales bacterium]